MRKMLFALSVVFAASCALFVGNALSQIEAPAAVVVTVSAIIFIGALVVSYAYQNQKILFMSCGVIAAGVAASCTDTPTAGTEVYCWLMNRDDVDKSLTQFDVGNPLIMTDLIMKASKYVYKFEGYKNSVDFETNMNKGKIINSWIHGGKLILVPNTPDGKTTIEDMSKSNLCAIIANKKSGVAGVQKFEFYGWDVGLDMTAAKRKANDADTQGLWDITLSSPEGEFESHVPFALFDTDEATTLAQIVALQQST